MLMFTAAGFTLSIFATFFEAHKTSDLNGIRSSGIAPRRREYKWRAPGVKNPSKNVARRVKDICFAVERLGRALYTRRDLLFLSSSFIFRERLQIRNESEEEIRAHRERDRSLSNRETFLFAARSTRERKRREVKS